MAYIVKIGNDTWSSFNRLAEAYLIEVKDDRLIVEYPERQSILRGDNVSEMLDVIRSTLENNVPRNSLAPIFANYHIPTRQLLNFRSGFVNIINDTRYFGLRFSGNKVVNLRCEEGQESEIINQVEKYYEEAVNW